MRRNSQINSYNRENLDSGIRSFIKKHKVINLLISLKQNAQTVVQNTNYPMFVLLGTHQMRLKDYATMQTIPDNFPSNYPMFVLLAPSSALLDVIIPNLVQFCMTHIHLNIYIYTTLIQ